MKKKTSQFTKIPNFSGYSITRDGVLREDRSGKILPWHKTNGYLAVKIPNDTGVKVSLLMHRALMTTYSTPPDNERIYVNHINGIRSDNRLENLEWVNYSENIAHAFRSGLRKDRITVEARNVKTGMVKEFYSIGEFTRYIGISRELAHKDRVVYGDWVVKYGLDNYVPGKRTSLVAKSMDNGTVIVAHSVKEMARIVGVCPKIINRRLSSGKLEYPLNGYDVKLLSDKRPWITYNGVEKKSLLSQKLLHCPVYAEYDGKVKLFPSIKVASRELSVGERAIRNCLLGRQKSVNGVVFRKHLLKSE